MARRFEEGWVVRCLNGAGPSTKKDRWIVTRDRNGLFMAPQSEDTELLTHAGALARMRAWRKRFSWTGKLDGNGNFVGKPTKEYHRAKLVRVKRTRVV